MVYITDRQEVTQLETAIEEAMRSTEAGVKRFVEPASGTLKRAKARRHHIIFGRRGSGKTSLLRKAGLELKGDGNLTAYVVLGTFAGLTYPDVLLSILREVFKSLKESLEDLSEGSKGKESEKGNWLKRIFKRRRKFAKREVIRFKEKLEKMADEIYRLLHANDEADIRVISKSESAVTKKGGVKLSVGETGGQIGGELDRVTTNGASEEKEEVFKRSKIDYLRRYIPDYQDILRDLNEFTTKAIFVFFDDLYLIDGDDQPQVLDYFHKVASESNLWFKVGTVRHKSKWYVPGRPPIGLQLGDDADDIDLDLTLEKFLTAKKFLSKILQNFLDECGDLKMPNLLTDGAIERLVLASGGVARDFLNILRRAIIIARNRGPKPNRLKIDAEDVNEAAGEYDEKKQQEFQHDGATEIFDEFQKIRAFCIDAKKVNCFLVEKTPHSRTLGLIHDLAELRIVHLVQSRVTVSDRPGKVFEAYLLDVGQYTGIRKIKGLEMIDFWKRGREEKLRRASLILE